MTFKPLALLPALLLCALPAGIARAETINCTEITSLPATISSQGVYCLKQDLGTAMTSGFAIAISANNVTLDCNGYKLGGLAAGPATQAVGIRGIGAPPGYNSNVTVRNCAVRGFATGIELYGSGHAVDGNLVEHSTVTGIVVSGDDGAIRRNRVIDTGGGGTAPTGIYAALDVDVIDNAVVHVFAGTGTNHTAAGIYTQADRYALIERNRIRDIASDGSGSRWGIFAFSAGRLILQGNHIVNTSGGGSAMTCNQTPDAIASDNVLNGFTFAMPGCLDGGGNVVVAP